MTARLFVHGTLALGHPDQHALADVPRTWATVTGHLHRENRSADMGYPCLIPDERGEPLAGFIFSSRELDAHPPRLDAFEGPGYRRIIAATHLDDGTEVPAPVYALAPARPFANE